MRSKAIGRYVALWWRAVTPPQKLTSSLTTGTFGEATVPINV